jgi:hypothetical protein
MTEEKDPILREIYALGYTHIDVCHVNFRVRLSNKKVYKDIELRSFMEFIRGLTIKKVILYDGSRHDWIAESDGSAEKLRNFIRL